MSLPIVGDRRGRLARILRPGNAEDRRPGDSRGAYHRACAALDSAASFSQSPVDVLSMRRRLRPLFGVVTRREKPQPMCAKEAVGGAGGLEA
jgi:hypothetical protein